MHVSPLSASDKTRLLEALTSYQCHVYRLIIADSDYHSVYNLSKKLVRLHENVGALIESLENTTKNKVKWSAQDTRIITAALAYSIDKHIDICLDDLHLAQNRSSLETTLEQIKWNTYVIRWLTL